MGTTSPFSLLFGDQLMNYGLNPLEWCFETWVCLREKSFVLRHKDDPDFKLKGCLQKTRGRSTWQLESLSLASI
jgi:hypothetical protein